jgi:cytochrome bd-type quinol oxidase subunit 2
MKNSNFKPKAVKSASKAHMKDHAGREKGSEQQDRSEFAFDKKNYLWLLIGLGFLLVGFLLMIGGGTDDPDVFNEGMFNFQRLTLSSIFLFIGYIIGIYAIMKKPKDHTDTAND